MDNFNNKDVITMKLLHYFITEKNYNPVVLHGAKDEIWLENMNSDYKIVRIVSNYIHNNEQLDFDIFKTKKIVKNIKRKTLNFNMNVLNIFVDLGDNVSFHEENNMEFVHLKDEGDLKNYSFLYDYFPDIENKLTFTEKGMNLFLKITDDINNKNMIEAEKIDKLFKPKFPLVTYILIGINVLIYLVGTIFGLNDILINLFANYGPYVMNGDYYRLISSAFLHANIVHLFFNMYALYVLGSQVESFFGKWKYLLIYFLSAIGGSLLSIVLNHDVVSVGASGAIFGILGALLYFGYNYRVYLGNNLFNQILPVVIANLGLGLIMTGIDFYAHVGGLVSGYLLSMAVGVTLREANNDRVNGIIMSIMLFAFLIFMVFFYL